MLDKRLLFVTGKGGVGKTTVSATLALKAAAAGKRTIVCEVAEQERMPELFGGRAGGHDEIELEERLWHISVSPERAKEEWLRYQLRSGTLAGVLGHSRLFQYLTAAAPGLTELVTMGTVWDLAQLRRRTGRGSPYDLVIVDAPATGQALAMLRAPRTFAEVARLGPIHRQAGIIDRFLSDRRVTGRVAVALAEEMPVNETLDLRREVRLDAVYVNGVYPERFTRAEAEEMAALDGRGSPEARAALRAALAEHRRARAQRRELRRLRRGVDAPVRTLPYVFRPELERADLDLLAARV
jgi:anion-transporting  ArsA/GET3 family ATPase